MEVFIVSITKKRLLALMLAIVMVAGSVSVLANESNVVPQPLPFTDVAATSWYYPHVRTVWENNLFQGTSADTFYPHGTVTRGMFIQVLANLDGANLSLYRITAPLFDDTDPVAWYFGAVQWGAIHEISHTLNPNIFEPSRAITREEMAVMLYNLNDYDGPGHRSALPFTDIRDLGMWERTAALHLSAAGILSGYNLQFMPNNNATRAEVAQMFKNYMSLTAW
jgi:hypothetical protein